MVRSEGMNAWCWFCDLTCQFVYDENRKSWYCTRCKRDLRYWNHKREEEMEWKHNDGLMDIGVHKSNRREHPRFIVELPFDYSRMGREEEYGGIAANASEGGLLVYLSEFIETGAFLNILIFFVKGSECSTIKGMTKVAWGDLAPKVVWGKHRYGLKFESFDGENFHTFKSVLREIARTQLG